MSERFLSPENLLPASLVNHRYGKTSCTRGDVAGSKVSPYRQESTARSGIAMTSAGPGSHYLHLAGLPWQSTRFAGVEMKLLWQDEQSEAFTAMFRMAPGATLPKHRHCGIEQTFVLEGSLVDNDGACTAGNFVWRDVGSVHSACAPDGCLMIGIFQQANEFFDEDSTAGED